MSINVQKYNLSDYEFSEEPFLNKKYGIIKILKIKLFGNSNQLVVIPGYSFNSLCTMFDKIYEGIDSIKNKYSELYMICWSQEIKTQSEEVIKGVADIDTQYRLSEQYRIEIAHVVDKILRSPSMDFKNFSILGKSAGGGISIYIASLNEQVKNLYICCPGTNEGGKTLINRKDLNIKLSWNKDDDKIPFSKSQIFINDFEAQGNKYKFYIYETGGHELNVNFFKEI